MPDIGSPMEILFLVVWRMRQQIKFQETRVIVQALLNQQGAEPKNIETAYEDLRQAFFPFEQTKRDDEIKDLKKVMHRELARGPLSVKPMVDLTRDNLKQKLAQGQAALQERATLIRSGRLQNLDRMDPFKEARSKKRRSSASLTNHDPARPRAPRTRPLPQIPRV